jgi:hypothetical protein
LYLDSYVSLVVVCVEFLGFVACMTKLNTSFEIRPYKRQFLTRSIVIKFFYVFQGVDWIIINLQISSFIKKFI